MAFCGGYRYKPTMSRTFSTNIASVLSLKLFTKCGFKPKACQIRRTESWEMPASLAMSQLLQWVLAAGVVSKVFVTTSSTFSSEISRGAPLRGASTMPSKDCSIKRRLHFPTMCWQTPNSLATSRLLLPWAHSNIPLARSAKLCCLLGRRSINLSFSSCSLLSLIGLTGRPLGILLLLQLAYPDHNTNVTDLSFSTLVSCLINNVAFVAIKMGRRSGSCRTRGGRISRLIRNRRATQPPAHFHRNPPGRGQLAVFPRCSLDPYDSDMGASLAP